MSCVFEARALDGARREKQKGRDSPFVWSKSLSGSGIKGQDPDKECDDSGGAGPGDKLGNWRDCQLGEALSDKNSEVSEMIGWCSLRGLMIIRNVNKGTGTGTEVR